MTSPCTAINSSIHSNTYQVNYSSTVSSAAQIIESRAEVIDTNLFQEIRNAITDLRSTEILKVIKTLAYSVFSKDELASKSLTGKRSILSGDKPLEQTMLCAIETVAMEKCPFLNHKEFVSKFQNILRRTQQEKQEGNV